MVDEGYIKVRDLKNRKERMIPISNSLVDVFKDYVRYRDRLNFAEKQTDYFFVKVNGRKCSWSAVRRLFKHCLKNAGFLPCNNNQRPRVHDLRHTFAVHSLAKMADSGSDLYVFLPILSCYLGHQSIESTNYYVRLTTNIFPDLIKDVDIVCFDVFPKLTAYEAN